MRKVREQYISGLETLVMSYVSWLCSSSESMQDDFAPKQIKVS